MGLPRRCASAALMLTLAGLASATPPAKVGREDSAGATGIVRPNCSKAKRGIVRPNCLKAKQGIVRPNCAKAKQGIVRPNCLKNKVPRGGVASGETSRR
jgi:hypothetical protein